MPDKAKSSIMILVLIIAVSLAFAGIGFYLLQKEKIKNLGLQEELDSLRIKQNATEAKLEEHKKTIFQLETNLKDAQSQMDDLNENLQVETRSKEEALTMAQQLRKNLEEQTELRSGLEAKLALAQKDAVKAQAQLKDMESRRGQLESRLKELESQLQKVQAPGVELGTIVVGQETAAGTTQPPSGQSAQKSAKPLEGGVLVVNKEYNFAVINLGSNDRVSQGDTFSVFHNENYIGDIIVQKVHESMSAADFASPSVKDAVSEGDRVVLKAK
ncbi:MAG: hypothetical protein PHE18_03450 [Candidatus Omnitrophica bacterium]|nr:hypothetical protein [Candidatus Omnitrophota bacterium]MDD5552912.1 hypothetical protein [Candidatus Omnitrophota bacterium]